MEEIFQFPGLAFSIGEGWIIEGVGVYPDIEVVDRPEQLAKGIDPCIEKAVEVLLQELKDKPVKKVTFLLHLTAQNGGKSNWIPELCITHKKKISCVNKQLTLDCLMHGNKHPMKSV